MIKTDGSDYMVINCDTCKKSSWTKRNGKSFRSSIRQLMGEGWRPEKINGKWYHFCCIECYFNGLNNLKKEAPNA